MLLMLGKMMSLDVRWCCCAAGRTAPAGEGPVWAQLRWGVARSPGSAVGFLCSAGSERRGWGSAGWESRRSSCVLPLNWSESGSAGLCRCACRADHTSSRCKSTMQTKLPGSYYEFSALWVPPRFSFKVNNKIHFKIRNGSIHVTLYHDTQNYFPNE